MISRCRRSQCSVSALVCFFCDITLLDYWNWLLYFVLNQFYFSSLNQCLKRHSFIGKILFVIVSIFAKKNVLWELGARFKIHNHFPSFLNIMYYLTLFRKKQIKVKCHSIIMMRNIKAKRTFCDITQIRPLALVEEYNIDVISPKRLLYKFIR